MPRSPRTSEPPADCCENVRQFIARLTEARNTLAELPPPGARTLPLLNGLRPGGTGSRPMESIHADAADILVNSQRCYRYGDNIVLETSIDGTKSLTYLTTGEAVRPSAPSLVADVFSCVEQKTNRDGETKAPPTHFTPPDRFVKDLLLRGPTRETLPEIAKYANHPVISEDYQVLGPGYHAPEKVLVHGPEIEAADFTPADTSLPIMERVPPCLREILRNFPFRSDADAANIIAALITGLLATKFIRPTKPIVSVDGNQPAIGKTLLARLIGRLIGGEDPPIIKYTADDEELEKKLVATLVEQPAAAVIIDNAKSTNGAPIGSSYVESMTTSPEIRGRLLGSSTMFRRPNDLLTFITMNNTRLNSDLASRCLPVRLAFDGDASQRDFQGHDVEEAVRRLRNGALAELFGMIRYWVDCGRPDGSKRHRCAQWANVVGGIMEACGFPEFLDNAADAAAEFNAQLDELAGLAEVVHRAICFTELRVYQGSPDQAERPPGLPASGWMSVFRQASVLQDRLETTSSDRARATLIGNFLGPLVGRRISISPDETPIDVELCKRDGSGNSKLYYFQFDGGTPPANDQLNRPARAISNVPNTAAAVSQRAPGNPPRSTLARHSPARPAQPQGGGNSEGW